MTTGTTLSHVFRHNGAWYFYDTVTDHIYECDEIAASVISVLDNINTVTIRAALDEKWGAENVTAACNEVKELQLATQALTGRKVSIVEHCPCCYEKAVYETELEHLQLNVTEQCNLRCQYCPYTKGRVGYHSHNNAYMSVETAIAATSFFLDHSRGCSTPAVSFYGGEPLLCFDLIRKVVTLIRERQENREFLIYLDTNGVLIDDEIAAYVNREKINLQVSLDGPKHIHDR